MNFAEYGTFKFELGLIVKASLKVQISLENSCIRKMLNCCLTDTRCVSWFAMYALDCRSTVHAELVWFCS